MTQYPTTVRELYPDDTRWGEGRIPAPLGGIVTLDLLEGLERRRERIRETIQFFEGKYPNFRWWEVDFVEERPATSLLMQSVNPERLAFQCMADITRLGQKVAEYALEDLSANYVDVSTARLALNALAILPDGENQLQEARESMTVEDRELFWQLSYGIGSSALQDTAK